MSDLVSRIRRYRRTGDLLGLISLVPPACRGAQDLAALAAALEVVLEGGAEDPRWCAVGWRVAADLRLRSLVADGGEDDAMLEAMRSARQRWEQGARAVFLDHDFMAEALAALERAGLWRTIAELALGHAFAQPTLGDIAAWLALAEQGFARGAVSGPDSKLRRVFERGRLEDHRFTSNALGWFRDDPELSRGSPREQLADVAGFLVVVRERLEEHARGAELWTELMTRLQPSDGWFDASLPKPIAIMAKEARRETRVDFMERRVEALTHEGWELRAMPPEGPRQRYRDHLADLCEGQPVYDPGWKAQLDPLVCVVFEGGSPRLWDVRWMRLLLELIHTERAAVAGSTLEAIRGFEVEDGLEGAALRRALGLHIQARHEALVGA